MMTITSREELRMVSNICRELDIQIEVRDYTLTDIEGWVLRYLWEIYFYNLEEMDVVQELLDEMTMIA